MDYPHARVMTDKLTYFVAIRLDRVAHKHERALNLRASEI